MSNQLATIEAKTKRLDELANTYSRALSIDASPFSSAVTLATAMQDLRELLDEEMMRPIMALMNSPLGFLTDATGKPRYPGDTKWKKCYEMDVVRDCVIEGVLRGFYTVGNEINIIAGRFYAAKNGLRRRVKTYPGLTDLEEFYDVPKIIEDRGAIVKCRATWKLDGKPANISREFAVKGDGYATADSYIGKATRKLLAAILEQISGICTPEGEVGETVIHAETVPQTSSAAPDIGVPETHSEPAQEQPTPVEEAKPVEPVKVGDKTILEGAIIESVSEKKGVRNGEKFPVWVIVLKGGTKLHTESKEIGDEATKLIGIPAFATYTEGAKGTKIIDTLAQMPEVEK